MESIKGRFAPSPTGRMHLGNAFCALLAWLSARSQGGRLLLRMEDLDPQRSRERYARMLMEDLLWMGLDWDEGAGIPGEEEKQYWQSRREEEYAKALDLLKWQELLYPCFWAILNYRVAHKLYKNGHYFWARWISQRSRRKTGIEIHPGATIGKGLFIDHGSGVIIGETTIIGDNVTLYQGVTLGGTGKEKGKRHPTLEDNVMVSAGAKILGSFTIGENSKIGAGSVVLKEVPPNCTVVGVPGRIVKQDNVKVPRSDMDQVNLPDPVMEELMALRKENADLNRQLSELEEKERQKAAKKAEKKKEKEEKKKEKKHEAV